jgi:hypothetical protein
MPQEIKVKTDNKIAELEGLEPSVTLHPNYQTPLKHLCVKFGYKTRKVVSDIKV